MLVEDWNGREIEAVRSRGGVLAFARVDDGLMQVDNWPPPAIVSKLYQSNQTRSFNPEEQAILTAHLGHYCDLQSVHSEDAITWNFFGTLGDGATDVLNWMASKAGLPAGNSTSTVALWRRLPHPDTLVSGGPEIDALLIGDQTVVAVEAKWMSPEGRGQGKAKDKSQLQLRNEFFAHLGRRVFGTSRTMVVAALSAFDHDLALPDPAAAWIRTVSYTWTDLAEEAPHPRLDEFARYYRWKAAHTRWRGGRVPAR